MAGYRKQQSRILNEQEIILLTNELKHHIAYVHIEWLPDATLKDKKPIHVIRIELTIGGDRYAVNLYRTVYRDRVVVRKEYCKNRLAYSLETSAKAAKLGLSRIIKQCILKPANLNMGN